MICKARRGLTEPGYTDEVRLDVLWAAWTIFLTEIEVSQNILGKMYEKLDMILIV